MNLAVAVDEPVLQQQLERAVVAAVCRCGCSSLRLRADQPPIPEARVAQLSGSGRRDYFSIEAVGHRTGMGTVQLVLHVIKGRIEELEVFTGEGVAVSLADVAALSDVTVA